jgi:hypothetical protein
MNILASRERRLNSIVADATIEKNRARRELKFTAKSNAPLSRLGLSKYALNKTQKIYRSKTQTILAIDCFSGERKFSIGVVARHFSPAITHSPRSRDSLLCRRFGAGHPSHPPEKFVGGVRRFDYA